MSVFEWFTPPPCIQDRETGQALPRRTTLMLRGCRGTVDMRTVT
jgi:hypothetical protein